MCHISMLESSELTRKASNNKFSYISKQMFFFFFKESVLTKSEREGINKKLRHLRLTKIDF